MIVFTSDLASVIAQVKDSISQESMNKLTEDIAQYVKDDNFVRIHIKGQKVDGSKIGNYTSKVYVDKRNKKGLQTSYIDLKFSGDLANSLGLRPINGGWEVTVGEEDLAGYLEDRYGQIWGLTDENLAKIEEMINDR